MTPKKEQARRANDGPDEQSSLPHDLTPISDADVRGFGFEPTRRGWVPLTDEVAASIAAADAHRHYTDPTPFRIPGWSTCAACDCEAEASTVGTPTCGTICAAVLMHRLIDELAASLLTQADGSGGRPPRKPEPITPARRRRWLPEADRGPISVAKALEALVDCKTVLERHGVDVRWGRMARCPFHGDRHASLSLYSRSGRSRAHCHAGCGDWSVIDLEAALAGEDPLNTIKRWSA